MLYDGSGERKYLTSSQRRAFIAMAQAADGRITTFALTLAYSGARLSEVLELTPRRIDFSTKTIVIRTLKRRRPNIFRTIPVPQELLERLELVHQINMKQGAPDLIDRRIWGWCRTTAWTKIKRLMHQAGIAGACAMPKGLRHSMAVEGTTEAGIPLGVMQKWMGHARIETTAIYANAVGTEERALACRMWK